MSSASTPGTSASPSPSIKEAPTSKIFLGAQIGKALPKVVGGKGVRIVTEDPYTGETREILDGMTGAAVGALGWGDDDVVEYITEAAKACTYQFPIYISNHPAEDLAKFYIENSPAGAFASALWTTSGSESNEMALKTIRQYWLEKGQPKKIKNLSRYTSYHGYSIAALSLGNSSRSIPFEDILFPPSQFVKLPEYSPFHYKKEGESVEDYSERLLKEYEEIIVKEDPDTIASLTVETISGTSLGTPRPTKTYLYGLRKLCDKYDIIFHLDEVMCGTGRINPGGLNCWENFLPPNEGPDLQTVGKTLGSGYVTIAGLLVSPKVKNAFAAGTNSIVGGSTYASHAFNCLVALKVQQKIKKLNLTQNMFDVGNYLGAQLEEKLSPFKIFADARGLGGFWTVEVMKDPKTRTPFEKKLDVCHLISNKAYAKGLNILGSSDNIKNTKGDFIMFAPHFTITKEDVDAMVLIVVDTFKDVEEVLVAKGEL